MDEIIYVLFIDNNEEKNTHKQKWHLYYSEEEMDCELNGYNNITIIHKFKVKSEVKVMSNV